MSGGIKLFKNNYNDLQLVAYTLLKSFDSISYETRFRELERENIYIKSIQNTSLIKEEGWVIKSDVMTFESCKKEEF